ncbi:hypothetical protein HXX76_007666 [Chlamydomonas incerta]|uniref:Uncharacterized protein n=1 Tax=Chlamydomonas incerta TaxID=51695 RepID=A0A835TAV2_CHLIN|nr:hypothetical protein HXX76_007666 [Chlamydomonas incerta]|eukprot:KAG2434781.1 hypothetical protein HXX76_007666 [Chlamydomonas incerta]
MLAINSSRRLGAATPAAGGQRRLLLRGGCAPLGAAAPPAAARSTLAPSHPRKVRAAFRPGYGDAAPGEQPPSSAGAPSDQPPDSGTHSAKQAQAVAETVLRQLRAAGLKLAAAEGGGGSSSSSSSSSDARLGEVLVAVADWALAQERGAAAELLLRSLAALLAAAPADGGSSPSGEGILELIDANRQRLDHMIGLQTICNKLLARQPSVILLNDARTRIADAAGIGSRRSGGSLERMSELYERPFLLDWALSTMLLNGRNEVAMAAAGDRANGSSFTRHEYRQIEGLECEAEWEPDWDGSRREARRAAFVRELSHVTGMRFRSEERAGKAGPEPAWWVREEPAARSDSSGDAEDHTGSGSGNEADGTG